MQRSANDPTGCMTCQQGLIPHRRDRASPGRTSADDQTRCCDPLTGSHDDHGIASRTILQWRLLQSAQCWRTHEPCGCDKPGRVPTGGAQHNQPAQDAGSCDLEVEPRELAFTVRVDAPHQPLTNAAWSGSRIRVTVAVQDDFVATQDPRLDERSEATVPVGASQSMVVRNDQQGHRTQAKVVEKGESVRAIAERCRRDIVQRKAQQATRVSGHPESVARAWPGGP